MARQRRRKGTLSGVLAFMLASMAWQGVATAQDGAAPAQPDAPRIVAAVWKSQEFSFYFHSFSTFYPCPSLNDKVRRLLVQLGADRSIRVRSSGCDMGYTVARSPTVRIRLWAPAEATPEVLAEIEKTRTTQELIARVRGANAQAMDVAAQFPAYWQKISLARTARNLDSGDCELIDAIKRQVLPRLSVRIVRDGVRCGPYQYSSGPVPLEVEALIAMPANAIDAAAKQTALREES
jgi:hypothetical protein